MDLSDGSEVRTVDALGPWKWKKAVLGKRPPRKPTTWALHQEAVAKATGGKKKKQQKEVESSSSVKTSGGAGGPFSGEGHALKKSPERRKKSVRKNPPSLIL